MADLPKQIRIAGKLVRFQYISKETSTELGVWGEFRPDELVILVCNEAPASEFLDTLLHEVFHAIAYIWNIQEGDDEERLVRVLGTAWQAVLVDNEHFYRHIGKLAKHIREEMKEHT